MDIAGKTGQVNGEKGKGERGKEKVKQRGGGNVKKGT